MTRRRRLSGRLAGLLLAAAAFGPAFAQKPGGVLQMPDFASPASMSLHEASTIAAGTPLMGVFNNLVVFDQHVDLIETANWFPRVIRKDYTVGVTVAEGGLDEPEHKLADDASRPVLLYSRFATCMQPRLKGLTTMTNSRFNGWRMEDVWLDR